MLAIPSSYIPSHLKGSGLQIGVTWGKMTNGRQVVKAALKDSYMDVSSGNGFIGSSVLLGMFLFRACKCFLEVHIQLRDCEDILPTTEGGLHAARCVDPPKGLKVHG